jgi:hypothetical protein
MLELMETTAVASGSIPETRRLDAQAVRGTARSKPRSEDPDRPACCRRAAQFERDSDGFSRESAHILFCPYIVLKRAFRYSSRSVGGV